MNRLDVKSNMNHQEADNDDESRAEEDANIDPPHRGDDDNDDGNDTDTGTDDDDDTGTGTDTGTDEDVSGDESVEIPTPDDVEHEYTYPQDFVGRSWQDVVPRGHYFRLILDPSCTKIPKKKFQFCKRLIELVVPENSCLTTIGHSYFNGCSNLQRITNGLPTTLLIIDRSAFSLCTALKGPLVIPPNVTFLGKSVFYECTSLNGQLIIPPNVTFFGELSFATCASLTSVVFQPSITATTLGIGDGCFFNCTGLVSVDLSGRTDELENDVFRYCTSLNHITMRATNVRFGTHVFLGCSSSLSIEAYPWLYPKIFASMNLNPSLIYQTFHQYHHRILGEAKIADDGVVTRQHPNGRRRRRQLHKRSRLRK